MNSIWTATASILLALGVILGAFGAHGLRNVLDEYSRGVWEKAVLYHFVHAIGLLIVAAIPEFSNLPKINLVRVLLLLGVVIFSGSLYLLAYSSKKWLGAITPIGGVSFIAAWLLLAWLTIRR